MRVFRHSRINTVIELNMTIKRVTAGTTSKIKYSSANKKIARVDAYGTVKAVKSGNTKIRVICDTKK